MPDVRFLNNVNIEGNETVLGNEFITGNETVSGSSYVTQNLTISGTTLALDTVNLSGNLNATGDENIAGNLNVGGVANFAQNINVLSGIETTGNVVASAFFGDGSNLTGIAASSGAYLPLSGGNMSGAIAFGPYSYSQRIDGGQYDSSRGGLSGISLICSVDYDFNWQAGWITALEQDRLTPRPLYIDSGAGTSAKVWDGSSNTGVTISHTGITFADGTTQTTASAFDSTYSTVCANSAQWSDTADATKLPLSGGVLTDGLTGTTAVFSGVTATSYHGDGTYLSGVVHGDDSRLTDSRTPTGSASGDLSGTYPAPTVSRLQGYSVSTQAPTAGQVLQWNGSAYVPGDIPAGGSGGGGLVYYLNYGVAVDSPTAGLSGTLSELGRTAELSAVSAQLVNVPENTYTSIAQFLSDRFDPSVVAIPAGIWDFNIWADTTASITTQMMVRVEFWTYSETLSTKTFIAASDDVSLYDPTVATQYDVTVVVPQTNIDTNSRLYVDVLVNATLSGKDVTLYFGGNRPAHVHTTIPSVGGSGLVKVINGVFQSPATLLYDADVATNAEIAQTKISGLTAVLNNKVNTSDVVPISSGGTGSTNAAAALSALGGFPIAGGTLTDGITATSGTFTMSLSAPAVSGAHYGSASGLNDLNASNITSGTVAVSAGGTGATDAATARTNLGVSNGASPNIQIFTSNGTWTKPVGAKQVLVECVAGGGGGGYGGKGSAGTALYGGAGGGGGGYTRTYIDATEITDATCAVTIGSGGAGGVFSTSTNATVGTTTFLSGATLGRIAGANPGGTAAGNGGTSLPAIGSAGSPGANAGGTPNITGTAGTGSGSNIGPSSGGAGGGLTAGATVGSGTGIFAGGAGGNNPSQSLQSSGGAASSVANGGTPSVAATRSLASLVLNGAGGGGGGACSFATGNGGNGANASGYGTGGGGGGATIGSGNGGNGGNGAPGIMVITTYF